MIYNSSVTGDLVTPVVAVATKCNKVMFPNTHVILSKEYADLLLKMLLHSFVEAFLNDRNRNVFTALQQKPPHVCFFQCNAFNAKPRHQLMG